MVSSTQAPRGIIMFDHEAWGYGTQADRQATAAKYVQVYQEIKARKPGWRIGWYADPVRKEFYKAVAGPGHPDYKTWQAWNTDLAQVMAPYTDVYFPKSLFHVHAGRRSTPRSIHLVYLEEQLSEVKRVRRMYGRLESPIYPTCVHRYKGSRLTWTPTCGKPRCAFHWTGRRHGAMGRLASAMGRERTLVGDDQGATDG